MTASIRIWAQGDPAGELVLYRWEADQESGFVTFEVAKRTDASSRRRRRIDPGLVAMHPAHRVAGHRARAEVDARWGV